MWGCESSRSGLSSAGRSPTHAVPMQHLPSRPAATSGPAGPPQALAGCLTHPIEQAMQAAGQHDEPPDPPPPQLPQPLAALARRRPGRPGRPSKQASVPQEAAWGWQEEDSDADRAAAEAAARPPLAKKRGRPLTPPPELQPGAEHLLLQGEKHACMGARTAADRRGRGGWFCSRPAFAARSSPVLSAGGASPAAPTTAASQRHRRKSATPAPAPPAG